MRRERDKRRQGWERSS